jgi:hypothetical protein
MKQPALAALFVAATAVSPGVEAAERTYSVSDFDRIRVTGPFRVNVIADRMTTVRGSGTTGALDRVRLDVQGRTLIVRMDRSNFAGSDTKDPPAIVTIRAPALREASLAGSGALSLNGMKGLRSSLVVEGSGMLTATNVQADRLDVGVVGTGTVALTGKVRAASFTGRGAGSVKAESLSVDDLTVNWESAGEGSFAATRTAKITSISTGNVSVSGKAACTVSNGGNGQVVCGD